MDSRLTNDMIDRFYRCIILLADVRPYRQEQTSVGPPATATSDVVPCAYVSKYHQFLDALCWLADYSIGGATVTSIGVEDRCSGPRYWVAANREPNEHITEHLRSVLNCLGRVHEISPQQRQTVETDIFVRSVKISTKKVQNYLKQLQSQLTKADKIGLDLSGVLDLAPIKTMKGHQLCTSAYDFCKTEAFAKLAIMRDRAGPIEHRDTLINIRHYVGRLASWKRSAKVMVAFAANNPEAVQGFDVEPLKILSCSQHPCSDQSLMLTIQDIIPNPEPKLTPVFVSLQAWLESPETAKSFSDRLRRSRSLARVHAEVTIAEHFYNRGLDFWKECRYIGCSKPSCYCCNLYLRSHPGRFESRPCHGNAWANWRPPITSAELSAVRETHTAELLSLMIQTMQTDICNNLPFQPDGKRRRMPDSATGLSTALTPSL